jgi:hypothetical protein
VIAWLIWTAPILAAIAAAASSRPPGRWLDRLFHVFGIGGIDGRRAAIAGLVILAVVGFGTDAVLTLATTLETPWRQLDAFAAGAAAALSTLMLAGWLNPGEPMV